MYYTAFVHILQILLIILSAESMTKVRIIMNYSVILTLPNAYLLPLLTPVGDTSCSACLRCVYSCLNHAINFRLLHFVNIPGGYDVKKSLTTNGNSDEKPNGKIPPFFQGYVK